MAGEASHRLVGIDVARAIALAAMAIVSYRVAYNAMDRGPAWLLQVVNHLDGRAAATFVTLAGIGTTLLANRDPGQARTTLLRRAPFLMAVGPLLQATIWPADILHFYAVYLVVGALLLTRPDRELFAAAALSIAAFPVLFAAVPYDRGWALASLSYDGFWTPLGFTRNLLYNGWHPLFPWLGFYLVGMWLGRRRLGDSAVQRRLIGGGLGLAVTAELVSIAAVGLPPVRVEEFVLTGTEALFGYQPVPPGPLYVAAALGTAMVVLGGCLWMSAHWPEALAVRLLRTTGQSTLTFYELHILFMYAVAILLPWHGGWDHGYVTTPVAIFAASGFFVLANLLAWQWGRSGKRGHVERLMRRLCDPKPAPT